MAACPRTDKVPAVAASDSIAACACFLPIDIAIKNTNIVNSNPTFKYLIQAAQSQA
jgi:hypothetical protein